ncbi:hypothetical protein BC940DRAFT_298772 [Gongronella butleri]|nr:hypothetical protein BC940DRAFT_298772 [Gongronella butleri]
MLRSSTPPGIELKTEARRRPRINANLKARLEDEFILNPRPLKLEKKRIAKKLEMTESNVHFWFQNRRAKASKDQYKKKMQQEEDERMEASVRESLQLPMPMMSYPIPPPPRSLFTPPTDDVLSLSSSSSPVLPQITYKYYCDDASSPPATVLPPISTIFISTPMWRETHNAFITPYFYHPPFGFESSYLQWKQTQHRLA